MRPSRWLLVVMAGAVSILAAATPSPAAEAPGIPGAVAVEAAARERGTVRLIARLASADEIAVGGDARVAAAAAAEVARRAAALDARMRAAGVPKVSRLGGLPLVVMEARPAQLDLLLRSGAVSAVQEDVPTPPGLAESIPVVRAPQAQAYGADGTGWAVAIIDTGVDAAHPFLAGRTVAEACFSSVTSASTSFCPNGLDNQVGAGAGANCPPEVVGCEHGTHVAGIALGRTYTGGPEASGVAPGAGLVSIQAFSRFEGGNCTVWGLPTPCALTWASDQIRAMQQVAAFASPTLKIAAANMSLVSSLRTTPCDTDVRKISIDKLRALGIATVIAAGNDGSHLGISSPACISTAVAVGATTTGVSPEQLAEFSDSAPMIDILAPGTSIVSSVLANSYEAKDGTSMSAPFVAGAFAALRSKAPDATVDELEQALESSGKPITDPENGVTRPRLDVYAALVALRGGPGWGAWKVRGGTLQSYPECEASGARIDCFAKSTTGTLLWARAENDVWGAWTDLKGTLASPPECLVRGTRIDCFASTPLKRLAQITYDGKAWGAWADRGGSVADRPSCVPAADGLGINCMMIGRDKLLYQITFDGKAWKPWQQVAGAALGSAPECLARAGGVDCLALDAAKTLQWRRLSAGKWAAWTSLKIQLALVPFCLAADARMDCFGQAASSGLLKGYYDGTKWTKWNDLGGSTVGTRPSCARLSAGFDCYWVTPARTLAHRQQVAGAWQAEQSLAGSLQQRPTCLAQNGGARIDCLARGEDGTLQQLTYQ